MEQSGAEKSQVIVIRDAHNEDVDHIQRVMLESYQEYEQIMPKQRWEEYKKSIQTAIYNPGLHSCLVAEWNGEIVGSVLLFLNSEAAYGKPELNINSPIIRLLATSPRMRGKGVATELIKGSIRKVEVLGENTLHLHTSDLMSSAVRLYERLGFERALDKEMMNGDVLVKCYRLHYRKTALI